MIGILAGMGPSSSAPFLQNVYAECRKQLGAKDEADFPPILLHSLPTPYGDGQRIDHVAMGRAIAGGVRLLGDAGASVIAIPCSTAHRYLDALRCETDARIVDMLQATVADACRSTTRVGIVATRAALHWGGYQARLGAQGVEAVVMPGVEPLVDVLLRRLTEGEAPQALAPAWGEVIRLHDRAGVDCLIVGCTDLSELATTDSSMRIIDAAKVLARATVTEHRQVTTRVARCIA